MAWCSAKEKHRDNFSKYFGYRSVHADVNLGIIIIIIIIVIIIIIIIIIIREIATLEPR
jgi:hypothetical protein